MSDELLAYYEKELAYIRQLGAEFAEENPKIAARLGINNDTIEDPHVSRLIESFAYLNARTQHKLDDDFPELTDAMLNVVFPHYQRPIPSLAIVQFTPDDEQLEASYKIDQGNLLETEQFQAEDCRFSTVYPVELLPVNISSAKLIGRPFTTPGADKVRGAGAVLHISLSTYTREIQFSQLHPGKIRLYLKGQPQHVNPLYELLLNNCHNVVIALSESDTQPVFLGQDAIQPVGFSISEGLLPYPDASFMGYRLLTEYFAFPEKFMFIDISLPDELIPENAASNLELYIYLENTDVELEHNISGKTFQLGCTPVINLFKHKADPIKLDHTQHEYQVIADMRRPTGYEVYSVDSVIATTPAGDETLWHPFYGLNHEYQDTESHSFWFQSRRASRLNAYHRDDATDVFLKFVDLDFNPNLPEDRTLIINTTCSNRDLPARLPYSTSGPKLHCVDAAPPCKKIRFITQPTETVRAPMRDHARWRILSHLNLNHLSITGRGDATSALKEILRLYDFKDSSVNRALVGSIQSVNARPISAPLTIDGHATMCRGIEVEILLDHRLLTGSSSYLFASVLEHFFALYCSINSFTRVLVKITNKEGYLKKCPPRAGVKVLL